MISYLKKMLWLSSVTLCLPRTYFWALGQKRMEQAEKLTPRTAFKKLISCRSLLFSNCSCELKIYIRKVESIFNRTLWHLHSTANCQVDKVSFINCYTIMFYRIYLSYNRHNHLINTELVAIISTTASVAQLAGHRARFTRTRVRFLAELPKVAFFATGPGWVL